MTPSSLSNEYALSHTGAQCVKLHLRLSAVKLPTSPLAIFLSVALATSNDHLCVRAIYMYVCTFYVPKCHSQMTRARKGDENVRIK